MAEPTTDVASVVNVKSTKREIYDAYRTLLVQHRAQASAADNPKHARERETEDQTLAAVAGLHSGASVATAISQARDATNRALDEVHREMEERARTSSSLQDAIRIQEARLKEWYDVERAAQDLLALLRAREEQERAYASEDTQRKEQRRRDDDAYRYEVEQRKRTDDDERRKRKQQFDEELRGREEAFAKREAVALEHEGDLERLRGEVATFPQRLEAVQRETREETEARLTKEAETERRLLEKEAEAQRSIAQSKIEALQQTIERQQQQLRDLQAQLQAALAQVQEVTLKTIEGTADRRAFQAVQQFAQQQHAQTGDGAYRNPSAR